MTVITPPILNAGQVVETSISDGEVTNIKLANPSVTIGTHVVPLGSTLLLDTDDVSEAGNLYYTDARVDARLSSGSVANIDVSGLVMTATGLVQGSGPLEITGDPASYTLIDSSLAFVGTLAGGYASFTNGDLTVGDIIAATGNITDLTVQTLATTGSSFTLNGAGTVDINGGGATGNITLTPAGSGYAHINSPTTYVGSFSNFTQISGNAITGNLTGDTAGTHTGAVLSDSITSSGTQMLIEGANTTRLKSTNSYVSIIGSVTYISNTAGTAGLGFNGSDISSWSDPRVTFGDPIKLHNQSADPGTAESGDMYFNNTTNKFRGYNGTAWVDLG
jgi:hypothetical protein